MKVVLVTAVVLAPQLVMLRMMLVLTVGSNGTACVVVTNEKRPTADRKSEIRNG